MLLTLASSGSANKRKSHYHRFFKCGCGTYTLFYLLVGYITPEGLTGDPG